MDPRYKSPETHVLQNDTDDFRDLTRHTTILGWLLLFGALCAVISVWSNVLQLQLLGGEFTTQEAQANDLRERSVSRCVLGVSLACFVLFGRWIVLAHRNLTGLGAKELDVTPAGALGWFFVPFANLWKPYQAMRTLWNASHDPAQWPQGNGHPILVIWWTLWIIASVLGTLFFRASLHATTIPELTGLTWALIINSALDIPQYIVGWLLVRKIWDAQVVQRGRLIAGERATNAADFAATA